MTDRWRIENELLLAVPAEVLDREIVNWRNGGTFQFLGDEWKVCFWEQTTESHDGWIHKVRLIAQRLVPVETPSLQAEAQRRGFGPTMDPP